MNCAVPGKETITSCPAISSSCFTAFAHCVHSWLRWRGTSSVGQNELKPSSFDTKQLHFWKFKCQSILLLAASSHSLKAIHCHKQLRLELCLDMLFLSACVSIKYFFCNYVWHFHFILSGFFELRLQHSVLSCCFLLPYLHWAVVAYSFTNPCSGFAFLGR